MRTSPTHERHVSGFAKIKWITKLGQSGFGILALGSGFSLETQFFLLLEMDALAASPSLTENDIHRDTNPIWILSKNVRFRAFEKPILPTL